MITAWRWLTDTAARTDMTQRQKRRDMAAQRKGAAKEEPQAACTNGILSDLSEEFRRWLYNAPFVWRAKLIFGKKGNIELRTCTFIFVLSSCLLITSRTAHTSTATGWTVAAFVHVCLCSGGKKTLLGVPLMSDRMCEEEKETRSINALMEGKAIASSAYVDFITRKQLAFTSSAIFFST